MYWQSARGAAPRPGTQPDVAGRRVLVYDPVRTIGISPRPVLADLLCLAAFGAAVPYLQVVPMGAVIAFEDVSVSYDGSEVLHGVSFPVEEGTVTVLTGPSGAGKTTLLRLCNRLEVPSGGSVLYRGSDVVAMDPLLLRRRVGMVFQRPTLFAGTLRSNFEVARPAGDGDYHAVLEKIGLPSGWLDRGVDELSGGEAQRACLARTLLTEPDVLLMDEPTSSLDFAATRVLEDLSTELSRSGITLLWVSHDLEQVSRIADASVVLMGGRVAEPALADRYLAGAVTDQANDQ